MSISLVKDSLKYYDFNNEKYDKIKKKIKHYKMFDSVVENNINRTKMTFYDDNKEELFTSRIEIIGKFYSNINLWVWGWAIPMLKTYVTILIRKILIYAINLDENNELLKLELITSRYRITNKIQIHIHCAIVSYLSKKPFIFSLCVKPTFEDDYNNIETILDDDDDDKHYIFILDPPKVD